jgi:galactokinase
VPRLFRAPGRVNLIGEHTDYNLGFVLPIAINLACYTAVAPSRTGLLRVHSENFHESREWPVSELSALKPAKHWSDYVIGVAQQLLSLGYEIRPADLTIYSTVPVGSGLSSSAAIEVATALALLDGREVNPTELVKLSQRAEREFVGMPCGIMDQYVSVFGAEHKAIQIDCRSITHKMVSLPQEAAIMVVNSMVKHELGASAYRTRVQECAEAVQIISRTIPGVTSLRDVSSADVDGLQAKMPDHVYRRARHVTTENERVLAFSAAAAGRDLLQMGRMFLASHRSLQRDYEVSCEELDFLVDDAADLTGVYGSRMTGGGFGGCTVNLVAPERLEMFEANITEGYRKRFAIEPQIYSCTPAPGAGPLSY